MVRAESVRLCAIAVVGLLVLAPVVSVVSAETHLRAAGNDSEPISTQSDTAEGTISLNQTSIDATAGESFWLAVEYDATAGSDNTSVYAAEFDIDYDPSYISITKIESGQYLRQDGTGIQVYQSTIDNQSGIVEYAATSKQATGGVNGTGNLLYLQIQINQPAPNTTASQQQLSFSNIAIAGPDGSTVETTSTATTVSLNIRPSSSIAVTPEPVVNETLTIEATNATDPDGSVDAYEWDLDADQEFDDGTGQSVNTTFSETGARNITLRITDNDGATSSITREIDVQPTNLVPVPRISVVSSQQIVNERIEFAATNSTDPDGSIVSYRWDLDGDAVFDDAMGPSVNQTFDTVGKQNVSLKLRDNDNGTARVEETLEISRQTTNLELTANATRVRVGSVVRFNTVRSDTDRRVNATVTASSVAPVRTGTDGGVSLSLDEPGEIRFRAFKADTENTSFQNDSVTIVVEGPAPRASFNYQPSVPEAGDTITFDASNSSVLNGTIVRYSWDLDGDNQFGDKTGQQVTSTFNSSQNTTVQLRVVDDSGDTDTTEQQLRIRQIGTGVELQPAEAEVDLGESRRFDIVATDLNNGVGAFIVTVSIKGRGTAEITDTTQNISSSGSLSDIQLSSDNRTATFDVATLGDPGFSATGESVLGTVTVTGQSVGKSDINITVTQIGNKNGEEYQVRFVEGANLTIAPKGPPALGPFDSKPKDIDNDGSYENVNGDGFTNVLDVVALFSARDGPVVSNNTAEFDFNDDGRANVLDVVALFQEVS